MSSIFYRQESFFDSFSSDGVVSKFGTIGVGYQSVVVVLQSSVQRKALFEYFPRVNNVPK